MSEINTGGPAFPTVDANRAEDYGTYGLTMRDYFAAKAMQAGISAGWGLESDPDVVAECAYQCADAMLKEREK